MADTVQKLADIDSATLNHEGRLLLLIDAFSSPDAGNDGVRGLTKLAKLDFLLRYPTYLERALVARQRPTRAVRLQEFEKRSVESRMIRYRFGPWDHRYPELLRRLEARGLISLTKDGRAVVIKTTGGGTRVATTLRKTGAYDDVVARAATLRKHLNLGATALMRFIYDTFPEVVSLRSNEDIDL